MTEHDSTEQKDMEKNESALKKRRTELKEQFLREEISANEYDKLKNEIEEELEKLEKIKEEKAAEETRKSAKEEKTVRQGIFIKGMTCASCERIIKKQAMSIDGVKEVEIKYSSGEGYVVFDESKTDIDTILYKIEENGYEGFILEEQKKHDKHDEPKSGKTSWFGYAAAILGIILVGYFFLQLTDTIKLPQISQNMSYGLLFLVGLLTGFHCVAMCGGFVVSYTAKNAQEGKPSYKSHISYGVGKLISYTVIGAAFGFIGTLIAFTPFMRGFAGIIAGIFLILFGLNMLNIFPILRKIRLRAPKSLDKFLFKKEKSSGPFVIGLLNGLMIACGPLQAIYIMAAGTGSIVEGAKLLFIFALGTLPVMLGFGYFTSFIGSKITHKVLKASGVIVVILGLIMVNRGLALTGSGYDINSIFSSSSNVYPANTVAAGGNPSTKITAEGYQEIKMDVLASGWSPNKFVLKKGVPVKWIINGKQITGCNNAIQVPKLGLKFDVKPGLQTIEFTPNEEGTIPFTCWMGMLRGTFIVKSDIDVTNQEAVKKELEAVPTPKGGSCGGGSGGGCGCGG